MTGYKLTKEQREEQNQRMLELIKEMKRVPDQAEVDALPHIALLRLLTPSKIAYIIECHFENERNKDEKRRTDHPDWQTYTPERVIQMVRECQ